MSLSVLVTGGAGYIGSHMVQSLSEQGYKTTVFDNLSRGFRQAIIGGEFIHGDLLNSNDTIKLFEQNRFDAVLHFAALAYVGESVQDPLKYYKNNVLGSMNLIEAMLKSGCNQLVFSSTCAIYGIPKFVPLVEESGKKPISPSGRTKRIIEEMLEDFTVSYGLNSISLRYFNAAGCDPDGLLGECHDPETHLIPLVLQEALRVKQGGDPVRTTLEIFGDDFDTPDGTCIRDYIHVCDLCSAHIAALERLSIKKKPGMEVYNLGNDTGFSVKEVIAVCREITGIDIQYRVAKRRQGDPPVLIASSSKINEELGWTPKYTHLADIVASAWSWLDRNQTIVKQKKSLTG